MHLCIYKVHFLKPSKIIIIFTEFSWLHSLIIEWSGRIDVGGSTVCWLSVWFCMWSPLHSTANSNSKCTITKAKLKFVLCVVSCNRVGCVMIRPEFKHKTPESLVRCSTNWAIWQPRAYCFNCHSNPNQMESPRALLGYMVLIVLIWYACSAELLLWL